MCSGVMIAMAISSAVSTAAAIDQANQAKARAAQQAQDAYDAADANTKAQYAETNRKEAQAGIDSMNEQSDRIRAANEQVGTMRATETALSDASLGTILFENAYGDALNYTRIDENFHRQIAAMESEKGAAMQNYINTTTQAKNQASNVMAEAEARKTNAVLNGISTSLSIANSAQMQRETIGAINGKAAPSATPGAKTTK
jgi:hypothetical protein